jgi:E3 ubiquitin-protein ligase ZSWIM2
MTPEDYEMLLRLDERVAPKTVSMNVISSFKTDIVDESIASAGVLCSVCMEGYEVGQKRKYLPCDHVFHEQCIDMWLCNSSQNCPLDGLPVSYS